MARPLKVWPVPWNIISSDVECYLCVKYSAMSFHHPLYLRCEVVKPQCMCQVSLRLKEVQNGAHDFKLKKVPRFARKTVNINVLRSETQKLALVPENRYNCDV